MVLSFFKKKNKHIPVGLPCPLPCPSVMEDLLAAPQKRPGNDGRGRANSISSNLILELVTQPVVGGAKLRAAD